jgi:hypothetical protein
VNETIAAAGAGAGSTMSAAARLAHSFEESLSCARSCGAAIRKSAIVAGRAGRLLRRGWRRRRHRLRVAPPNLDRGVMDDEEAAGPSGVGARSRRLRLAQALRSGRAALIVERQGFAELRRRPVENQERAIFRLLRQLLLQLGLQPFERA